MCSRCHYTDIDVQYTDFKLSLGSCNHNFKKKPFRDAFSSSVVNLLLEAMRNQVMSEIVHLCRKKVRVNQNISRISKTFSLFVY